VTVVATRTDPPLFRAGVRWPVGVGHDWWTCDAVSAHVAALQRDLQREGVALEVDCDRNSTTVRIEGPHARFDGAWTRVLDRLGDATITDEEIRTHVDATLARRRRARADPDRVFESLVELATWEDGGAIEHALPTDEALERVNRTLFEASLLGVIETRPAVLYAGPDPTALGDRLPAAGLREPPEPRAWRPRRPDRPLVLVVDLPGATTAVLTVSMAAPGTGGPEAATIYGQLLQGRFVQRFRDAAGWGRMDDVAQQLHAVGDTSFVARAWVAHDRVPAATEAALALMGGTIDRAAFDGALRSVEESVRADRVRPHRIPETAIAWTSASDPRLVTWERLAAADIEALQQYVRAAAQAAPVIAVGGELRQIDLDALRELGTVTVVERDDLCRGG
jgi:hypothetical protein